MVMDAQDHSELDSVINDLGGDFAPAAAGISEDFVFDSSETTEDDVRADGFLDLEGMYHFEIVKVTLHLGLLDDDGKENTPHIDVLMRVLQSVPGQSPAGSMLTHKIYVASKGGLPAKKGSIDSMYRFAIGIGLMKWHVCQDGVKRIVLAKTLSTKIPVTAWRDAVGLQTIAKVTKEKSNQQAQPANQQGQTAGEGEEPVRRYDRFQIQMGRCFRPDDPDYAHVPKNFEAMKAIGLTPPVVGKAVGTSAKAAATQAYQKNSTAPSTSPAGNGAATATATASSTATAVAEKPAEGGMFDDY